MTIVITCGVFDLIHEGHLELLEEMKNRYESINVCNSFVEYKPVIFLHDDFSTFQNKNKFPVQSFELRKRNLESLGFVVIKVDKKNPKKEFSRFFKAFSFYSFLYIRGDDWFEFPGVSVIRKYEIPILYKKYTKGISSTILRENLIK
jgi:cytidyltransferase-like protein